VKRYKISISPEAVDQINEIYSYIANESPLSARQWYGQIKEKLISLEITPARCPVAFENRFYKFELRNLLWENYRILFRIEKHVVQILCIKHARMERIPFDS
jgi:toxin ParE1/3/4